MSIQINNIFQSLPELSKPFTISQCILFKNELLICGGYETNDCIQLNRYCVIQLLHLQTNSNEINLLFFEGQYPSQMKQIFLMKYKKNSKYEHDSIYQSFNTNIRGLIGGMNNDLFYPKNIEVIDRNQK
ncbi:hypothetical protein RFI_02731 [Reticulomyxa filosa]|uniref:Kelch motif family protein n=1 Tax=Reticulomyxa filosa TaxID=46433 RepID=X6P8D6_RETFI|nr:hypothetical protein RFI_02731 [Reticulomyxa filosa]|eukprot:ETO34363.1 hypothetical protein RFI_02731 [Reticulomyxa filosa]